MKKLFFLFALLVVGVATASPNIVSTTQTSATVENLDCGTKYRFEIRKYMPNGDLSPSAESVQAETKGCSDSQPPSQPPNLTSTGTTATSISVSWTASTDDVAVTGYDLFRGAARVDSTSATSYTFGGLSCDTSYTLAVEARDAAGNRSSSSAISASTKGCADSHPPSQPQNVAVTAATQTSISVSWGASTDNVGVTGYALYSGGTRVATTSDTAYTYTGLTCGTSYTLAVAAYDAAGNQSNRAEATETAATSLCADTEPPSAPTGLVQTSANATSATLSWQPSTDEGSVVGYGIYVGTLLVASTRETSYVFTGLPCASMYGVGVDAVDAANNRSPRTSFVLTTSACPQDTTRPSVPQGLTMTAATESTITLDWDASTDNVGVTGYALYRGGTRVATTSDTAYTYTGLTCGTSYTLAVAAYDAAGNESNRAEATTVRATLACPAPTPPPPPPSPPPSPPPPPPPPEPGVPGSASVFVSAGGSDANACTESAPCRTFNRAYQLAACGDTVVVRGGSYPAQTIAYSATKQTCAAGSYVTFTNAAGETVNVNGQIATGGISSTPGAEHVGFQAKALGQFTSHVVRIIHAEDFLLDRMDSRSFYINGSQNVTIRRSDFGPCNADLDSPAVCQNNKIEGGDTGFGEPEAILIEGNTLHDFRVQPGSAKHWECLLSFTGRNVTIRGNKFFNCEFFDMLVEECCGFTVDNWLIENNWFDAPFNGQGGRRSTAFMFGASSPPSNFTIRFNSFENSSGASSNYALTGTNKSYGNLQGVASCIGGFVASHNTYAGPSTCGGVGEVARNAPFPYVGSQDYRLTSSAGKAPSDCPTVDIEGQKRTAPCDRGADELVSAPPVSPPPVSPPPVSAPPTTFQADHEPGSNFLLEYGHGANLQPMPGATGAYVTDRAYAGQGSARFTIPANRTDSNIYARSVKLLNGVSLGDTIKVRAAFWVPVGFYASLDGPVDIMRFDNWSSYGANTDQGGISIYGPPTPGETHLIHKRLGTGAVEHGLVTTTRLLDEGQWTLLEFSYTFSATNPDARLYKNGTLVGSSTTVNWDYSRPFSVDAIRFGFVATKGFGQAQPMEMYVDKASTSWGRTGSG